MKIFRASYGNWHFTYLKLEGPKQGIFDNFCGYPPGNKNCLVVLPQDGDGPWMQVFPISLDFPASGIITVTSKK